MLLWLFFPSGRTFYECEKCRGLFPTLTLLQVHMKGQHPGQCAPPLPLLSSALLLLSLLCSLAAGSPSFPCPHCSASFHLQEALKNHVASEHSPQADQSLGCGLCGELFPGQEQLEEHCRAEHPKVVFADAEIPATHIVQVSDRNVTLAQRSRSILHYPHPTPAGILCCQRPSLAALNSPLRCPTLGQGLLGQEKAFFSGWIFSVYASVIW